MNDIFSLGKGTSEFTKRQRIVPNIHDVIECCQETNSAYVRTCTRRFIELLSVTIMIFKRFLHFLNDVFHTKKTIC